MTVPEITQEDVDCFMASLKAKGTPWADGCAALIGTLWNGYVPSSVPSETPLKMERVYDGLHNEVRLVPSAERVATPDPWEGYRNERGSFEIEKYISSLKWSEQATEHEKALVAGNLRNLYAVLKPNRDEYDAMAAELRSLRSSARLATDAISERIEALVVECDRAGYTRKGSDLQNKIEGMREALDIVKNAAPQERPLDTNGGLDTGQIAQQSECVGARGEAPRVPAVAAPSSVPPAEGVNCPPEVGIVSPWNACAFRETCARLLQSATAPTTHRFGLIKDSLQEAQKAATHMLAVTQGESYAFWQLRYDEATAALDALESIVSRADRGTDG